MANVVDIQTETSAGSMQALLAGIEARSKALEKTTEDSTVAAAITILRSLKAATKAAKRKATDQMYQLSVQAYDCAGWRGNPHRRRPVVDGIHLKTLRPVNLLYGKSCNGHLYRIFIKNANLIHKQWKNYPYIFLLAENDQVAKDYAIRHIENALKHESGIAKAALAIAQAKISTRSKIIPKEDYQAKGLSIRASGVAYDAGDLKVNSSGFGSGEVSVEFIDHLKYSIPASGGDGALDIAIAKAANSMLGAYGGEEMRKTLETLRIHNPEAKFVDIFRMQFTMAA